MKKLLYLFLVLPFSLLISCNDDKDFSPVDIMLTLSGVTESDGDFMTVAGEEVSIDGIGAKSIDGKNSALTNITFYLNGAPLIGTPGNPFQGTFSTEGFKAGTYYLSFTGNLLQEGAPIQIFTVDYPIIIFENQEDLPENAPEIGTYTHIITIR
ncbi:MAG: hypothetical protein J1F38_08070 [Muribaculaceae bacterium]|nr:hypothetical protein [Muribaculaceae bacterium]